MATGGGVVSGYSARIEVPQAKVPWRFKFEAYSPVDFSSSNVDGEPLPTQDQLAGRFSYAVHLKEKMEFSTDGRPLNPTGRTGLAGRGDLPKWGPNHVARCLVTREGPGGLEAYLSRSSDTEMWRIPQAFTEAKQMMVPLVEEDLYAAAGSDPGLTAALQAVLLDARILCKGYVEDDRNTDHAWVEGVTSQLHIPTSLSGKLTLESTEASINSQFVPIAGDLETSGIDTRAWRQIELCLQKHQQSDTNSGHAKPRVPHRAAKVVETNNTDPDKPQNTIVLEIMSARNLVAMDKSVFGKGSSDPYVKVYRADGTKIGKTHVVQKNLNPVWNSSLTFSVLPEEPQLVSLEVYDHDNVGSNEPMGKADVDLSSIPADERTTFHLALTKSSRGGKFGGEIEVALTITRPS